MQNYLAPLQCPLKNKNGCQAGGKATEETVSKYAVFCTKFLRCAIETLKKVKAKQKGLFEVTDALKLGKMKHVNILSCCLGVRSFLACENIRFSSLFVAGDVSRGGMSTTQRQKFHTDDASQCLHNKSSSHGVPNINLSNFMCLLVGFGILLCSSTNELQQNSNTSSRENYIPQILTVLLEIL